ncbi:L,D-transpeptidase family protein [Kocuria sabuli]|uniref:L,D-transpeptidase family protein n=1 Tax=Kocuria sabuli TaxID=3071448 RepID=UPI0034D7B1B0
MKISALRTPAALAACFAVVLAGAPGAAAAPSAPVPGVPAAPTSDAASGPDAAAAAQRIEPVDDDLTLPGTGRAVAVDVLANDGLVDPAQVRLLLVDPAAPRAEDELGEELRTELGSLRVISPDTAPQELPEGWQAPEHPVLVLLPDTEAPAGAVEVGYAVRDAAGAEARAVLTLTPEPTGTASPEPSGESASEPAAEPSTGRPSTGEPSAAGEPTADSTEDPAAEPTTGPAAEPTEGLAAEPSAGARAAAADPGATADVPAEVRRALEASAARVAARSGEPTAGMRPWKGGWEWPHQYGVVLWHEAHGAHWVQLRGAIGQKWLRAGDVDVLGWPLGDESCGLVGGGCRQSFSKSHTVYWSPGTGARAVKTKGAIGHKWILSGWESGAYGYPVTDEICGLVGGGCRQSFSKSHTVYWSPGTGARAVKTKGAIGHKWILSGWESGAYGYPVTDEICGLVGGGCRQSFSKSHTVYWSPGTGARAVKTNGAIGQRWIGTGRERGTLGYPVVDETGTGTVHQKFQRGLVTWSRSGGSRIHLFRGECHHLNTGRSVQPTRNAGRVSLTIAEGYGRSEATFVNCVRIAGSYVEEWRTSAYVGASGFKRPGVPSGHTQYLYSPQGSYSVTESFGVYNPGTALPYRQLNPNSRWGGRPGSLYNKYFESTGYTWPDENMWYFSQSGDYRLGVVINYNRPPDSPIVQGNGFAIFLHANKKPTAGCIALHEHEVARYMRTARPGDRIIMGVRADLFR